ncbi:Uracil-DNA glycosylase [Chlamydiales bacterium SCGC AG-110-M15]|nr:Uracil-DNA glycosylase [Chlamydiales bacterium SCGC AG-110-M15]
MASLTLPSISEIKLHPSWLKALKNEIESPYFHEIFSFLNNELNLENTVYPSTDLIFEALNETPFDQTSVVIMGQDPYHGKGQAHGLSFSVQKGLKIPPSLQNIYKELYNDLKIPPPNHGTLISWAKQGVLLLNATLTVRAGEPKSHFGQGWEKFTDAIISKLAMKKDPIIFVLWGQSAKDKCLNVPELAEAKHHTILTAPHPSPFSARTGFFGCKHFSKINQILTQVGKDPINWEL